MQVDERLTQLYTSRSLGYRLVPETWLPPLTGENQGVSLRSPPMIGKHRQILVDVLRPHLRARLRGDTAARALAEGRYADIVDHSQHAILGGWGSGKTTVASDAVVATMARCGYHEGYEGDHPKAFLMAPTGPILHDTAINRFKAVIPKALIAWEQKQPWAMGLVNGLVVYGKSADAANEGFEGCILYCEEIDHVNYWRDPKFWPNMVARIRDPHAPIRRIIVCGLPTWGPCRDQFTKATTRLHQLATTDNPAVDEATLEGMRTATSGDDANHYIKGGWQAPEGAIFRNYDPDAHIVPDSTWRQGQSPVHLSLDAGNHGFLLWYTGRLVSARGITGQPKRAEAVLCLADYKGRGQSIRDLMTLSRNGDYPQLGDGGYGSVIAIDPKIRDDERSVIREFYPRARILQRVPEDPYYHVKEGIRTCKAALRDDLGNVTMHFLARMAHTKDGVITGILDAKRHPKTGETVKNDRTDHARDAWRYATTHLLQVSGRPGVGIPQ